MSTSSRGGRYEGRRREGWLAYREKGGQGDRRTGVERNDECIKGQKRDRQKREKGEARREARGARRSEKGKNEGGGAAGRKGGGKGGGNAKIEEGSEAREGKIVFIRGLKLKRSEKTAIRKPAKWRRPTKGRLDLFIFFFLPPAEGRD